MKKSIVCFFFILLACFVACIDEIEFDAPNDFQNSIVITGKLVIAERSTINVRVQQLFDFTFPGFIKAKSINLIDEDENSIVVPLNTLDNYSLEFDDSVDFDVSVGKSYKLRIEMFDGQLFESTMEPLVPSPRITSIQKEIVERDAVDALGRVETSQKMAFNISTPLIPENETEASNLRWEFQSTYKITDCQKQSCYVDNGSFLFPKILDSRSLNASELNSFNLSEIDLTAFLVEGMYYTVIQESLSETALNYWNQVDELSVNSGTFFEPPPGQLITNFQKLDDNPGKIFGYFYASQQDTMRIFLDSLSLPSRRPACPPQKPKGPGCDVCCDCSLPPSSSLTPPKYWVN